MSLTVNSIRWDGTGEPAQERRNLELEPKLLDEETVGNDGGEGQRMGLKNEGQQKSPFVTIICLETEWQEATTR